MAARAPVLAADTLCHCIRPCSSRSLFTPSIHQHARHRELRRSVRRVSSTTAAPSWGNIKSKGIHSSVESPTEFAFTPDPVISEKSLRERRRATTLERPDSAATESLQNFAVDESLVSSILAQLEDAATIADKPTVQRLVVRLVRDYGKRPDAQIYTALLLAEADPSHGSAAEVERMLQQMDLDGITIDSAVYHAALKALAIHPNYILREKLLGDMERRWLELHESGWHSATAALFRERQVELGLKRLSDMRQRGYAPPRWLLHLAIATCLSIEAFLEALALLKHLTTYPTPVPSAVWSLALTSAANAHSHPLVDYVWRRAVEPAYLNPSSGACIAVLDTAARHGNFRLATDVFRVLGARNTPLQAFHYEALMESYLHAGDLPNAVAVLQLMARNPSVAVDDGTVRSLVRFLASDARTHVPHCLALLSDPSARPAMPKPHNRRQDWTPRVWEPAPVLGACIEALARAGALDAAWQVYWSWDAYHRSGIDRVSAEDLDTIVECSPVSIADAEARVEYPNASVGDSELTSNDHKVKDHNSARSSDIPPPSPSVYIALFDVLDRLPDAQASAAREKLRVDLRSRGYVLRDGKLSLVEEQQDKRKNDAG